MSSLDAMERLAEVMNNTARKIKLGDKEFEITALKPGTQWLIAEESIKIQKNETSSYSDVIKQFAVNIPSVVKVIALAILNDKDRIFSDYKNKVFSKEYESLYNTIMWDSRQSEWIKLLFDILQMLDLDFFFNITKAIATLRDKALVRKQTKEERKSSSAVPNGGR